MSESCDKSMSMLLEELLGEVDLKAILAKGADIGKQAYQRLAGKGDVETKVFPKNIWELIRSKSPSAFKAAKNQAQMLDLNNKQSLVDFATQLDRLFTAAGTVENVVGVHRSLRGMISGALRARDPNEKKSLVAALRHRMLELKGDFEKIPLEATGVKAEEISVIASVITEDIGFNNGLVLGGE